MTTDQRPLFSKRFKALEMPQTNDHPRSTAGIIVIGDEILKGQTHDTNSYFLCKALYDLGVQVKKVSVIPDEIDIIAEEVSKFSHSFTFVITSGGIGPTHDDLTYTGIAKAFNEDLIQNEVLMRTWSNLFRLDRDSVDDEAIFKMSAVPVSAKLHLLDTGITNGSLQFPIISVHNVYIFPGIPSYLEQSFDLFRDVFSPPGSKQFHQRTIYLDVSEFQITKVLNRAVSLYKGRVQFGSYPNVESDRYQVKLTLEADTEDVVEEAEGFLRAHLPPNCIVGKLDPTSKESVHKLLALSEGRLIKSIKSDESSVSSNEKLVEPIPEHLASVVKASISVVEECLMKYTADSVCLSFNGGKDCTVLLHIAHAIFATKYRNSGKMPSLKALYVTTPDPFPEIESFIQESVKRYNLQLYRYEGPIKEALEKLKLDHPEIQAILMGTRQTDPQSAKLMPFHETDPGWPKFVRVHPLLHWNFHDIWAFLRALDVPYCSLYDRGYTSLGCKTNTCPNPKLAMKASNGSVTYLPAYMLKDPSEERDGRC